MNVALFPSQTLVGAVTAAEGIVEMSIGPIEGHVDPHGDSFFMKKAYTLFIEVPFISYTKPQEDWVNRCR